MSLSILDKVCFIADSKSKRFVSLKEQISIVRNICENIYYIYKYNTENIDNDTYCRYYGLKPFNRNTIHKLDHKELFTTRAFAVVLNHLECFSIISKSDPEQWSMICEDDILIHNKENFIDSMVSLMNEKPENAELLWISSGKKEINCTYRNITGHDPDPKLDYNINTRFCKIPESRYADCVVIKNSLAIKLITLANQYKISYPIDWEYNFWLKIDPSIHSYWVQPAIIKQNPEFMAKIQA